MGRAGNIWLRPILEDAGHIQRRWVWTNRIKYAIARYRLSREIVDQWVCRGVVRGKISRSLRDSRDDGLVRKADVVAKSLPVSKEENLVPLERAAQGNSILILLNWGSRHIGSVVEEAVGIENGVAEVFIRGPVDLVRPRFSREVQHTAVVFAVFRADVIGLYAKFLNRILRRNVSHPVLSHHV